MEGLVVPQNAEKNEGAPRTPSSQGGQILCSFGRSIQLHTPPHAAFPTITPCLLPLCPCLFALVSLSVVRAPLQIFLWTPTSYNLPRAESKNICIVESMKVTSVVIGVSVVVLLVLLVLPAWSNVNGTPQTGNYYSLTERRMPCGRILRREVLQEYDGWRKTVTLLDPTGRILDSKTRTVEPEQCSRIQAGRFVPGLWRDCTIAM
jgi:hypothetical protein